MGELKTSHTSILISINKVRLFLFIVSGRCNASDEWCGWISQDDARVRWSLKMATDLRRAGKGIASYAGYDEGKKSEETRSWALPVKKDVVKFVALGVYTTLFCRKCT